MTLEEAIELINSDVVNYERLTEARKIATEALEKQIAKKPAEHHCPVCKNRINIVYNPRYCECCGQAIDWSGKK